MPPDTTPPLATAMADLVAALRLDREDRHIVHDEHVAATRDLTAAIEELATKVGELEELMFLARVASAPAATPPITEENPNA